MKETLRHSNAFLLYYALSKRSLPEVARRCSVSESAVKKWSIAFGWQERVTERDREIAARVEKITSEDIAEKRAEALRVLYGLHDGFSELVESGGVQVMNIRDYERVIKLTLLLTGQPTDRTASVEAVDMSEIAQALREGFTEDKRNAGSAD